MYNLDEIKAPVKAPFDEFERLFAQYTSSPIEGVNAYISYVCTLKGKQLRPLLTLLSAGLFGTPNEKTVSLAAAMEILHNTSLIHDDVVDESVLRRNSRTLNALSGNKVAVLTGDYLFSQVLKLCADTGEIGVVKLMAELSQNMGEGELMQQYVSQKQSVEMTEYYAIIEKKTAVFMSQCCRLGAYSNGASEQQQQQLADFGLAIGTAFQIKDDVLDYTGNNTGKPMGNDIREKKMTLPLIYFLQHAPKQDREEVKRRFIAPVITDSDVDFIITKVSESGALDYSKRKMAKYCLSALEELDGLPQNACLQSLENLSIFIINRNQ